MKLEDIIVGNTYEMRSGAFRKVEKIDNDSPEKQWRTLHWVDIHSERRGGMFVRGFASKVKRWVPGVYSTSREEPDPIPLDSTPRPVVSSRSAQAARNPAIG